MLDHQQQVVSAEEEPDLYLYTHKYDCYVSV